MSNVLHRTTLQYLKSVNTPDYDSGTWVINPDMTPVDGVLTMYWVLTGDVLSEMSQGEKDTVDAARLPAYKAAKVAAIDTRTDELIAVGFTYESKQFSLSLASQSKMTAAHQIKDHPLFVYPVNWNTIDDTDVFAIGAGTDQVADAAIMSAFYMTAIGTIRVHLDSGTALKGSVRAATALAEVDAVVDLR